MKRTYLFIITICAVLSVIAAECGNKADYDYDLQPQQAFIDFLNGGYLTGDEHEEEFKAYIEEQRIPDSMWTAVN